MEEDETRKRTAQEEIYVRSYYCVDYSRGYPETDDLAVFKKNSGTYKFCILDKSSTDARRAPKYVNGVKLSGRAFDVDLIPNEEYSNKVAEKLLLVDRPLCVGDLVTLFANANVGTEKEKEMWNIESNNLGVVLDRRIVVDVCLYPDHKYVIRGIKLDREGVTTLFEKDLVTYGTWVGRARNHVYNVNVVYKERYRATVKVSHGKDGLTLRRPYSYQSTFPYVKGEIVLVPKCNQFVQWRGIAPRFLRRGRARSHRGINDTVPTKIESYGLHEVDVDWFYTSVNGSEKPRKIWKGNELSELVDLIPDVNFLNCALNSITMEPQATDRIISMVEYKQELGKEFDGKFEFMRDTIVDDEESDDTTTEMSPKRARLEQDEQDESIPGPSTKTYANEWEAPLTYGAGTRSRKCVSKILGQTVFAKIVRTQTFLRVKWSNGEIEDDLPSHQLVSQNPDIDQEDHVIDSIVIKKTYSGTSKNYYGVIRKVDESDRSCLVRWFSRTELGADFENLGDEECTLFDIMKHPRYTSELIGHFGINPNRGEEPVKEHIFNVVAVLDNGKMRVRYLDERMEDLNLDQIMMVPVEDDQADDDDRPQEMTSSFIWDQMCKGIRTYLLSRGQPFPQDHPQFMPHIERTLRHILHLMAENTPKRKDHGMFKVMTREMNKFVADIRLNCNLQVVSFMVKEIEKFRTLINFSDNFTYFVYNPRHHDNVVNILESNPAVNFLIDLGNVFRPSDDSRKVVMAKIASEDLGKLVSIHGWTCNGGDGITVFDNKQMFLYFLCCRYFTAKKDPPNMAQRYESEIQPPIKMNRNLEVPKSFGYIRDQGFEHLEGIDLQLFHTVFCMTGPPVDGFYFMDMRLPPSTTDMVKILRDAIHWPRMINEQSPLNYREMVVKEYLRVTDPDQIRSQGRAGLTKALKLLLTESQAKLWNRYTLLHYCDYPISEVFVAIKNLNKTSGRIRTVHVDEFDKYAEPCPVKGEHECARKEILRWRDRLVKVVAPTEPTPVEMANPTDQTEVFSTLAECPRNHSCFKTENVVPSRQMLKALRFEFGLFKELPSGIFVRAYEDRADLLSALIVGPDGTPYEGVPFLFDIHLPDTYPNVPPKLTYVPLSKEQLNPNLYQTGRVCVSLLGTWEGKGTENWVAFQSSLMQVFISIQSMILVAEPFYNEAGYEARRNEPDAISRSQRYSEVAAINAFEYMHEIYRKPPVAFEILVKELVEKKWHSGFGETLKNWAEGRDVPLYPNLGPSKGFQMAVRSWHTKISELIDETNRPVEEEPVEMAEPVDHRYNGEVQWIVIPENRHCFAGIDLPLVPDQRTSSGNNNNNM